MDAGQEPGAIERAVIASERRVYRRRPWYHHRALWGGTGIVIGFAAGVLWQQILIPDRAEARTTSGLSGYAAQSMEPKWELKPELPAASAAAPAEKKQATKPEEPKKPTPAVPAAEFDFPILPPPKGLSGHISEVPVLPDIKVAPVRPAEVQVPKREVEVKSAPTPEQEVKGKAIRQKIAELRLKRDELLKTFYEDAVPVRHLDEDIAAAESELAALKVPS